MTRLLIYGKHNTGKTYLLRRILEMTKHFILIDSTCEEGNKSIINQKPELFDIIITPKDLDRIIIEKPERCGVDVSWNLERYFESNSNEYLKQFLREVHGVTTFLKATERLSERYIIGMDEIPLFPRILKDIANYKMVATGDESIISHDYILDYFEIRIAKTKDRQQRIYRKNNKPVI